MHPRPLPSPGMRDLDTIDSELRLIAALRRTAAEMGAPAPRIDPAPLRSDRPPLPRRPEIRRRRAAPDRLKRPLEHA